MSESGGLQSILGWAIVALIPFTLWVFIDMAKRKKQKTFSAQSLAEIPGFSSDRHVLKTALRTNICQGLAIDTSGRQLCLIAGEKRRVIAFEKLLSAEIIVDGTLVTRTSRLSQLAGVAVGAAIGGGVGAVIGGVTGAKSTQKNIKEVTLKLMLKDLDEPSHSIQFIEMMSVGPTPADQAIVEAQNWLDVLKVIVFENTSAGD